MLSIPPHSVIMDAGCTMPQTPKYDIFLDGSCSFCRWSQAKIEPYDSGGRLRFLDYNDAAVAAQAPFPRADLDQEMYMRTPEGKWLRGFEAWLALLHVLPGLQACRPCVGWALPCTALSRATVTVFPARPRAARPIRVLPLRTVGSDSVSRKLPCVEAMVSVAPASCRLLALSVKSKTAGKMPALP